MTIEVQGNVEDPITHISCHCDQISPRDVGSNPEEQEAAKHLLEVHDFLTHGEHTMTEVHGKDGLLEVSSGSCF